MWTSTQELILSWAAWGAEGSAVSLRVLPMGFSAWLPLIAWALSKLHPRKPAQRPLTQNLCCLGAGLLLDPIPVSISASTAPVRAQGPPAGKAGPARGASAYHQKPHLQCRRRLCSVLVTGWWAETGSSWKGGPVCVQPRMPPDSIPSQAPTQGNLRGSGPLLCTPHPFLSPQELGANSRQEMGSGSACTLRQEAGAAWL